MGWKPEYPGEIPTLGFIVLDWISTYLAAPDRAAYEPLILYREQAQFVVNLYALDPKTGKRKYQRGLLSRSRGWGKSPLLAALCCAEALGEVVPDGWDANGRPVAKPWCDVRTPLVQIAAVSEAQTKNTWTPLLEMLRDGHCLDEYPGLEPLDTFVNLPRGKIEPITSASRTVKGNRPVFCVLDQTEEWVPGNGGPRLAQTIRINARKVGGSTVESPNAFTPGEGSVAEESANYAAAIAEGTSKDKGLLYDHREAPADTDLADRDSLIAGLEIAYGDSSRTKGGHVDVEDLLSEIWNPATPEQVSRSDFLNQITHAPNSWISQPEWAAISSSDKVVADRELITLGFDGSRGRARGKPDATALIACRVSDGHLFQLAGSSVWEAADGPGMEDWTPPIVEIEATIAEAFRRYSIAGFYCDPAKDWRSHVNAWEAKYVNQVQVKASNDHPFEWWMTGGRSGLIQRAVEQFEGSVRNQDMTHDGTWALTRHVLNARRRVAHGKLTLGKEHDYSSKKIDAAVAAMLAWQARLDAIAKGVNAPTSFVPRRIR